MGTEPDPTDLTVDPSTTVPSEAREFQGMRAGVVSRTIAASVDFAVVVAVLVSGYVTWSAALFLYNPTTFSFPTPRPLWLLVAYGVVLFLSLTIAWTTTGRTYGSHVMGLRVVNFRGERVRLVGAVVRSAFCVVFPLGLFWCAVSRQNRSVQDIVLRTSAIYDWAPRRASRTDR